MNDPDVTIKWVESLDELDDPAKIAAAPEIDPRMIVEAAMAEDGSITTTGPDGETRTTGPLIFLKPPAGRMVCACGRLIPRDRTERCSDECDQLESDRHRAEQWREVMRAAADGLDEWIRHGMPHGRRDWR